jgi:hypothetical protein
MVGFSVGLPLPTLANREHGQNNTWAEVFKQRRVAKKRRAGWLRGRGTDQPSHASLLRALQRQPHTCMPPSGPTGSSSLPPGFSSSKSEGGTRSAAAPTWMAS